MELTIEQCKIILKIWCLFLMAVMDLVTLKFTVIKIVDSPERKLLKYCMRDAILTSSIVATYVMFKLIG